MATLHQFKDRQSLATKSIIVSVTSSPGLYEGSIFICWKFAICCAARKLMPGATRTCASATPNFKFANNFQNQCWGGPSFLPTTAWTTVLVGVLQIPAKEFAVVLPTVSETVQ